MSYSTILTIRSGQPSTLMVSCFIVHFARKRRSAPFDNVASWRGRVNRWGPAAASPRTDRGRNRLRCGSDLPSEKSL